MRRDVTELKQLVLNILEGQGSVGMLQKYEHLFDDVSKEENSYNDKGSNLPLYLNPSNQKSDNFGQNQNKDVQDNSAIEYAKEVEEEAEPEPEEEETLSLEKKEKEMIIKALDKNNNRRKYAAQDLGISERTLYRKIKQYELDK